MLFQWIKRINKTIINKIKIIKLSLTNAVNNDINVLCQYTILIKIAIELKVLNFIIRHVMLLFLFKIWFTLFVNCIISISKVSYIVSENIENEWNKL